MGEKAPNLPPCFINHNVSLSLSLSLFSLSFQLSLYQPIVTSHPTHYHSLCWQGAMQTKPCRLTKGLPRERETLVSERGRERETVGTRDDFIGSNTLVVIGPRRAMGWCFSWKGFRSRSFMSLLSLELFILESSKPADWHKRVSAQPRQWLYVGFCYII